LNELRLIKKIQRNGDRAATDELVRCYYDEIYGFVRKQVLNADIALDLTQEIFISMLRTIGSYDMKRGARFRTWIYRIATNKVVDWFRSRAYYAMTKTVPFDGVEPIDEIDFTRKFEDREFMEKVCDFVGSLVYIL
jgi:RNA polymerase sigma factor (sigma-70 family)